MKLSWIWKTVLCTMIYVVAAALGGMLVAALGLRMPAPLAGGDPARLFLGAMLGAPILVIGLAPLALRLGGRWLPRAAALFLLMYLSFSLNTVLEIRIFSSMLRQGGSAGMLAQGVVPALALCAGVAWYFRGTGVPHSMSRRGGAGWAWRIALAVLSFPLIYYTFGAMVGPLVVPHYNGGGQLGLVIPPQTVILRTQLVRSSIFLIASLPAILLWTGSRRGLIGALGLAHAVLVGIYGMATAGGLIPAVLRVAHGLEITADSFAYAAVLAWLLAPRPAALPNPRLDAAVAATGQ